MRLIDIVKLGPIGRARDIRGHEIVGKFIANIGFRIWLIAIVKLLRVPFKLSNFPIYIIYPLKHPVRNCVK